MQQFFDPIRHKNVKARVKEAIKSEFNQRCAYCGSKSKRLTLDHVLASSKGGINSWRNLVPACAKCNGSKGSKNLSDWYTLSLPCYSEQRLQRILNRSSVKSGAFVPNRSKGFAWLGWATHSCLSNSYFLRRIFVILRYLHQNPITATSLRFC
jgi:hypothetical protein